MQKNDIKLGERKYIVEKSDPIYGIIDSVAIGFDKIAPHKQFDCPKPCLDTLAIEMTLSGKAVLCVDDSVIKHTPDSIMAMFPSADFYELTQEEEWCCCWFVIWGALPDTFVSKLGLSETCKIIPKSNSETRVAMFEVCRLVLEQPDSWMWPFLRNLTHILDYVMTSLVIPNDHSQTLIGKASVFMKNNVNRNLTLDDISSFLCMSKSDFCHKFSCDAGTSPIKYFRQLKMVQAKELLCEGFNVSETSEKLGFENPYHFSKLFKHIVGITPSTFIKESKQFTLRNT
ncbi:helix-turn-helix domain-containing protein [Planctomycetota bacterium]